MGMPRTQYDILQNVKKMAEFMAERHLIYLKRKAGLPGPWTRDEVLRDGRFCNVFRELDRVTIWIRKHIREPFADHPHLWYMLAIARYINWPPTLQALIETPGAWPKDGNYDPRSMTEVLEALADEGCKVYTGAYMIRAESDCMAPWYVWTKHKYLAEVVCGKLWESREEIADRLRVSHNSLQECWGILANNGHYTGWGPFMSYEWVTDLRHTRYLRDAQDIYSWANAGPGAIRGLNRLYERTKPRPEQACEEMNWIMGVLNGLNNTGFNSVFGEPLPYPAPSSSHHRPRFEMRDVEHVLCEYDKYQRVTLRQGKMRSNYFWPKAEPLAAE